MKYYIFKGYTDSNKDYLPIIKQLKEVRVIDSDFDMLITPPEVEKDSIIIGFSLGALIAFRISQKQKVKKMILCSMSLFLGKDLDIIPIKTQKKYLPRPDLYKKMNYRNSKSEESIFLCGSKEPKILKDRVRDHGGKVISGVDHKLSKRYINEILKNL